MVAKTLSSWKRPGNTRSAWARPKAYSSGLIHSTAHPHKAWVICITGTGLGAIARYRVRAKTDNIVETV